MSFTGGGSSTLEVGGRRLASLPVNGGTVTGNYALGQLVVGQPGEVTIVTLADAVDNGNRGTVGEVLYLSGLSASGSTGNGLHIFGGSTLVLGSVDLHASQNGQWLRLNDLFTNGQTLIAYDQGYFAAAVPEPATWALWTAGMLGFAARRWRAARQ